MNACQRNDSLLRKMVKDGCSLSEIGRAIGTNKRHVKAYILSNCIPHEPFVRNRPLEKNGRWKGGSIIDKDGYRLIKSPNHPRRDRHNYVREHRLVMEKTIGRYLDPREVVHHKDGNKLNNSPENLELFQRNSEHLAKELAGRIPHWTEDGRRRILEGCRRPRGQKPSSTRPS